MRGEAIIAALRAYAPHPRHYGPCKITFELGSPVVLSMPWIMFDGLLAYALAQDLLGSAWHELDWRKPLPITENLALPLDRVPYPDSYLYKASCSRLEPVSVSTIRVRKRACSADLGCLENAPAKIDSVRGDLKSYDMELPVISARTCTFHAVGDPSELRRLCGAIDCLGKKRSLGCGRVMSVRVESEALDRSFFLDPGGLLNKPIPVAALDALGLARLASMPIAMLAYKPPYWERSGMVPCVAPEGF